MCAVFGARGEPWHGAVADYALARWCSWQSLNQADLIRVAHYLGCYGCQHHLAHK